MALRENHDLELTWGNFYMKLLILTGPTATGKSKLSLEIADKFNCEIVNIDSMQVYKYFDIGTDKPDSLVTSQYPHHLLSYVEPDQYFDVKKYISDAEKVIYKIYEKGKIPLLVGGTGLYIKCLLYGIIDEPQENKNIKNKLKNYDYNYLSTKLKIIDFESYKKINKNDKYRTVRALSYFYNTGSLISEQRKKHCFKNPLYNYLKLAINFNREALYEKINIRVDRMIEKGLIEETETLIDKGYDNTRPMNGIGYKEIKSLLSGKIPKERAIELIKQNSRKYAKRQITWFRKETDINWIDLLNREKWRSLIEKFLEQ